MRRIDKILQFYDDARLAIAGLIRTLLHAFIIDPLADSAPALAPLVPAISTYRALAGEVGSDLGISNFWLMQAIAISGAIAIEAAGMSVSKTALRAYRWSLAANKTEARFPWYVYTAPAICFYCVVIVLTLTIEYSGILWAVYPLFVLVAVSTYISLAIADNLAQWEKTKAVTHAEQAEKRGLAADIRRAKNDIQNLAAERAKLAADIDRQRANLAALNSQNRGQTGIVSPLNGASLDKANEVKKDKISHRRQQVLGLKQDGLTHQEIADRLAVSVGTIKNDVRNLNGQLAGVK
jgi:DNA-binding CsgD family transcriptional regulator